MGVISGHSAPTRGIPFVVSAPSGAGKSSLIKRLRAEVDGLGFSVSHTTRSPRRGEADGAHYHFVTRTEFERLAAEEAFAEWAEVHGNLYGTSYRSLEAELSKGRDVILDIDVQGALQIADKVAGAVLVFVVPPSWAELRRRLETRGLDSSEVIERRIANARGEVAVANRYRYVVLNDDMEGAVADLAAIVRAERCRTERRVELVEILSKS